MTDFAVVYGAALAATREKYPTINESPTRQLIATAWHRLRLTSGTVDDSQTNTNTSLPGGQQPGITSTSNQRTTYWVRFRVYVVGGKPFKVRIEGEASKWVLGEVPSPLKGAEVPPWLGARTDSLRVAIHRRLQEHAVPLEVEKPKAAPKGAALPDSTSFGEIPASAGKIIARVSQAADGRKLDALRLYVSEDVAWSRGTKGVDAALAIWAADGLILAALSNALSAGCVSKNVGGTEEVVCPGTAATGEARGYIARFRLVGGTWKLTSFFEE